LRPRRSKPRQTAFATWRSHAGSPLRAIFFTSVLTFLFLAFVSPRARADVGVVLNESLDESVDRISSTGHSAVYLSRICPESPIKLRLCGPGENGSVMSNYINMGEDQPYEWNVASLNMYLFGVEDPRDRSLFASYKVKHLLEERYRDRYLATLCTTEACRNSFKSEWREMVGATLIRGVYIFVIKTTEEQDLHLIAEFNDSQNKNHFNGFTNNCADFTRRVINTYFPKATHPDYLNDFLMTSPKAIARTFTHFAQKHPESELRVYHFTQVPGTIKRSREVRSGTEQLFHAKVFLIPMLVFADYGVPAVAGSYLLTGRFNPEHEFERRPALENVSGQGAQSDSVSVEDPAVVIGSAQEWKSYRKALDAEVAAEIQQDNLANRKALDRFFKQFEASSTPVFDDHGAIWMQYSSNDHCAKVGVSASNILAVDSDPQLAHQLLLARVHRVLKSPKHGRETMSEFVQDWAALQRASDLQRVSQNRSVTLARSSSSSSTDGAND
jgi:hypothetical protein